MLLIAENLNIDQNKFQAILIHPAIPQGVEAESFWKPKAKSFPTLLSCPLIITSKAEIGWEVPSLGTQRVENWSQHLRRSWSFPNLYSSSVIYSFIKTWIHQIFLKHESLGLRNTVTTSHDNPSYPQISPPSFTGFPYLTASSSSSSSSLSE